ncbi:MAG: glycosyl hydrolase family 28 protein [Terracidiphilus sp.]|nr:glycosyl hydrolase family 28 protein [Terracidiphilus sp.]
MLRRFAFLSCIAVLAASVLAAQDRRIVTEPKIPAFCSTLDAQLAASGRSLSPEDEQKLDTERIQHAIDSCNKGYGVLLRASNQKNAFLSGPLALRPGVALVVDKGVTLFASRNAALYASAPGSCGLVTEQNIHGCKPLISVDRADGAAVMGQGIIDGRGGESLLGSQISWWDLAEQARAGGAQQNFRIVVVDHSDNFTLYGITLKNSPNFHVTYNHGSGFTAWGVHIDTPQRLARNTDGIDPGNGARNVTIAHSWIRTGDDNVAIKGGTGGARQMTIAHNHFYWGHGMSIGSETDGGVGQILVTDLSLDGPDNGIRIKSNGSRGGLTEDVVYSDVCIRNSPNPIMLDTAYNANGALRGDKPPSMRAIALRNVRVSGGGKLTFNGYDQSHRIAAQLDGVQLTDQSPYKYIFVHSDVSLGPGATDLQFPKGDDSTLTGSPASATPPSCTEKFVPFEQN